MVSTIKGVSASPEEDNILKWNALIIGPPDTPFEDGTFKLILQFTEKYPNEPPKGQLISKFPFGVLNLPKNQRIFFPGFLP